MAVTTTSLSSDLVLLMDAGIGVSGKPLSKSRTFKNVKADASNEDLYEVAQALIDLQSRENNSIQRRDVVELEEE